MTEVIPSSRIKVAPIARDGRSVAARAVAICVGLLLLFAAEMKWRQFPLIERMDGDLFHRQWFVGGQIIFEAGLAAWLISGFQAKWSRIVALVAFSLLTAIALYKGVSGADSCGCFGQIHVSPWYTAALDVTIIVGLMITGPPPADSRCRFGDKKLAVLGVLSLAVVGWNGYTILIEHSTMVADDGLIQANGGIIVLEPEKWVGKAFPLQTHVNVGNQLMYGRWIVLLYHADCPTCREAIPLYQKLAQQEQAKSSPLRVALIEMPPVAQPSDNPALASTSDCLLGTLDPKRDWFASTPVMLVLKDGIVVSYTEGQTAKNPPKEAL